MLNELNAKLTKGVLDCANFDTGFKISLMKVILFSLILIFNSLVSAKTVNVILDPGHGGQDRGAEYHGATEAIVNLQ
ncbi:MAG: N-acetylmuramoyl-L-alanine amidase, partial [Bdellovibrionales bacterium]|nr:N-acetylmuramoyl-L-alanine amidase [Bdellovibrionales bacterium]